MWNNIEFYIVFLSQIVLISWYLPISRVNELTKVINKHPPNEYPKLYPVSLTVIVQAIKKFKLANLITGLIGIALIIHGLLSPDNQLLSWNNESVVMLYFILQLTPFLAAELSGYKYFQRMREFNTARTRKAELSPRKIMSYVSPVLLGLVLVAQVIFIMTVIYFIQHPFKGFGGYGNIVGMFAANLFLFAIVVHAVYGKKLDPYQSKDDRFNQIERVAKSMLLVSLAMTLYLTLSLILSGLELRQVEDLFLSLYCQIIAVTSLNAYRFNKVNFDVYRNESIRPG